MVSLPGLNKGVTKDPTPPAFDTEISPITIPDGTTLVTTKTTNETIDNVDQLIDYVSGDNSPNFIPQLAIENLVSDLVAKEDTVNKGAVSGYAGLDASQELLLANFPSGNALEVLRRNAANTGLEFVVEAGEFFGPWTANHDAGGFNLTNFGFIESSAPIPATTGAIRLGNFEQIAWTNGAGSGNIIFSVNPSDQFIFTANILTPILINPTIADFSAAQHDHEAAAGAGQLDSTLALSDTANIAYLNTANTYIAGTRQDFLGLLAGTAGLNVGGIAGNPTTQVNGDIWLNTSTNQIFGRINGVDVDLSAGGGTGITSINGDTTAAQIIAGTTNVISVATVTATTTIDIDAAYVGQASITTLGTITTGVWTGTAITGANINAASTDLTDSASIARSTNNLSFFAATTSLQLIGVISDETGSGLLVFGTSPTIVTPTITSFTNAQHNHQAAAGGSQLVATLALTATGTKDSTTFLRGDDTWAVPPGGGTGDVVGPASSVDNSLVIFDGTTGKIIQQGTSGGFEPTIDVAGTVTWIRYGIYASNAVAGPGAAVGWIGNQSNEMTINGSVASRLQVQQLTILRASATAVQLTDGINLILGAGTNNGYIQLDSISSPASTGNTAIGRIFMDADNSDHLTIQRNGVEVDLEAAAGGSDTPWIEDHDAAGFDLNDLGNIQADLDLSSTIFTMLLETPAGQDTGANPMFVLNARRDTPAALTTRPIFDIRSDTSILWRWQANGDVLSNIPASKFEIFKLVDGASDELNTSSTNLFIEIDNAAEIGWDNSSGDFANAIQFNSANNFQVRQGGTSSDLLFQVTSTLFDMQGLSIFNPTAITDAAINEQIIFGSVASAVNEFTITNAISANGPILAATGDATNIDINITPKGTGIVNLNADVSVSGDLVMGDRFQGNQGADIVGAATITLGDGNYFDITGNTNIDFMTTTGWQAGSVVVLQFDANSGVNDGTASPPANTAAFDLAGNFTASAGDTITVVFDGTVWREISRSVN